MVIEQHFLQQQHHCVTKYQILAKYGTYSCNVFFWFYRHLTPSGPKTGGSAKLYVFLVTILDGPK